MKTTLLLASIVLLTSCASERYSDHTEADTMLYICRRAAHSMVACVDDEDLEACETTDYYLTRYPWLRTKRPNISNLAGMTQGKWDSQIKEIGEHLKTIGLKNTFYVIAQDNRKKQ